MMESLAVYLIFDRILLFLPPLFVRVVSLVTPGGWSVILGESADNSWACVRWLKNKNAVP
jgi:hypothetical protein